MFLKPDQELRNMLEDVVQNTRPRRTLMIDEMYVLRRTITQLLWSEKRWQKYAEKSREMAHGGGGEDISESVLEHIVDKFFIGTEMLAVERERNPRVALEIDTQQLYLAFFVYGLRVARSGDVPLLEMTKERLERDDKDFRDFLEFFAGEVRQPYLRAHETAMEREMAMVCGRPIDSISLTGKFLWAVVLASFIGKSLYEVKANHAAFANTFHNLEEDVKHLSRIFYSFRRQVEPRRELILQFMAQYPRWEE